MGANASVAFGGPMSPDREAEHQQQLRELYADEADQRVRLIEEKLAGVQAALADAIAEAQRLRAEAQKGKQ
jgi:hypothetical protein